MIIAITIARIHIYVKMNIMTMNGITLAIIGTMDDDKTRVSWIKIGGNYGKEDLFCSNQWEPY